MSPILILLLTLLSLNPSSIERSIVRISYGASAVCTGFVVSATRGEALTAAHCLPQDGEDLIVDGELSYVVRQSDLFALVSVEKMKKPPLSIRKREAEVGEESFTFGYAWGQMLVFHRWVAGFLEGDVAFDGPLAPGMSGGPVVDLKGDVIGINQASNDRVGVACGVKEIQAFLEAK